MIRYFLKGTRCDAINTVIVAAYSMRHWMNIHALSSFVSWLLMMVRRLENMILENENQYTCDYSILAMVAE